MGFRGRAEMLTQSMRDGQTFRDAGQRMTVRTEWALSAKQGGTAGLSCPGICYKCRGIFVFPVF